MLVVIDFETGGLDPVKHPITQIGFQIVDETNWKVVDSYQTFVKPYDDLVIDEIALNKQSGSLADIKSGVDVRKMVVQCHTKFLKYRKSSKDWLTWVGHNATFDIQFLKHAWSHLPKNTKSLEYFFGGNKNELAHLDTQKLAGIILPKKSNEPSSLRLPRLAKVLEIELTGHDAMADVVATTELLKKLISGVGVINNEESTNNIVFKFQ